MNEIKTNSLQAWVLAARPKTLSGAAVPVMIGLALAISDGHFRGMPALLCFLFAFLMQIDANFINDYYDCKRGLDNGERLGPKRACTEGWITMPAMRKGIAVTTVLSCLAGLPLVLYGGWPMVVIGVLCVVFCFLYTTCLASLGLGDVLVVAFFGVVPVFTTYYLQTQLIEPFALILGFACGLAVDTLLVVNNYRDREQDKANGKKTLAVIAGEKGTEFLYLEMGFCAAALCQTLWLVGKEEAALLVLPYFVLHFIAFRRMRRIRRGKALNEVLEATARNILLFGVLLSIGLII